MPISLTQSGRYATRFTTTMLSLTLTPRVLPLAWFVSTTSFSFTLTLSLQATQHLRDGWRSVFGSSAIAIVNAFFDSHLDYRDSNKMCVKFAMDALDNYKFIYFSANGTNHNVCRFRVIKQTIANNFPTEIQGPLLGPIGHPNICLTFQHHQWHPVDQWPIHHPSRCFSTQTVCATCDVWCHRKFLIILFLTPTDLQLRSSAPSHCGPWVSSLLI